jgi:hypothetical protein
MNQNSTQLRHTLIFGTITGGGILVYLLVLFFTAMLNNKGLSNIASFLFIIGGYISVRNYRNEMPGGFITFGKAYGTTFLTFLFAGIVWAVFEYILYKFLSPGLLEEKLAETQEALLKLGWSEDRVEAFTKVSSPTSFSMALGYLFSAAMWGALVSLIIAAIVKRDKNPLIDNE